MLDASLEPDRGPLAVGFSASSAERSRRTLFRVKLPLLSGVSPDAALAMRVPAVVADQVFAPFRNVLGGQEVERAEDLEVATIPSVSSRRSAAEQIGEAAREEVRGFCEVALTRVNKTVPISREQPMKIAAACIPFASLRAIHAEHLARIAGE